MSLSQNIKQVIALLNKAIKQTPIDKQPVLSNKVARVLNKYSSLTPQDSQAPFLKELEFNLNFIKLSFPHLDYSPPPSEESLKKAQEIDSAEEERAKSEFVQLQNKEQVLKFVEETKKVLQGVRQEVEFSNWGTGNLDPQDLKRHKELLKRQYFGGQFWKEKEKPMSPTASFILNMMEQEPQRRHEKIVVGDNQGQTAPENPNSQNWEKVKR